jgi:hypothetical protein
MLTNPWTALRRAMTEAEWLASDDPMAMLESLRGKLTERKLRLVGCACFRAFWDRFTLPENRATIEIAERMADGLASAEEISERHRIASFARDMATGPYPDIRASYKDQTNWFISLSVYGLVLDYTHGSRTFSRARASN